MCLTFDSNFITDLNILEYVVKNTIELEWNVGKCEDCEDKRHKTASLLYLFMLKSLMREYGSRFIILLFVLKFFFIHYFC